MTFLRLGAVVALIGSAALVSCTDAPQQITQTAETDAFAKTLLDQLQPRSIAESREYCGYIFASPSGRLTATPAQPGGSDYCELDAPDANVVASYHTHGSFSREHDSEIPSLDDMQSDIDAQTDGYISTPGGRLWKVDFRAGVAYQVCGESCITSDPNNDPDDAGFVAQSYTLRELRAFGR